MTVAFFFFFFNHTCKEIHFSTSERLMRNLSVWLNPTRMYTACGKRTRGPSAEMISHVRFKSDTQEGPRGHHVVTQYCWSQSSRAKQGIGMLQSTGHDHLPCCPVSRVLGTLLTAARWSLAEWLPGATWKLLQAWSILSAPCMQPPALGGQ